MFSINLRRNTNNLDKLIEKMEKLEKESVATGVFAEQGEHPNAEMSYVELAIMHEQGDGYFPPRTVRPIILNEMKSKFFIDRINEGLNKYLLRDLSLNYSLSHIGQYMSSIGKSFFGEINMPYMSPNAPSWAEEKGKNTPLVDEGYLRDAWAYKTSVSSYIVDGSFGG